jgi:UDP:flavonoid glycosyltransferase YjiC (YdhE family)
VFAYVSARYWGFARLIDHLAHVGHPTVVYARDLDAELAESLTTATLRFSPRMVALDAVSEHAELVVGHGGHGTTATALLGARPVLVLPEHGEQALLGHRLSSQNLGIDVGPRKRVEHDYAGLAERMLADPTFADAARHFAADHEQHDQRASIVEMASVCEALLRR